MFVSFYSLLHSLSPFRTRYGFNCISLFFPLYHHIQNNATSFSWFFTWQRYIWLRVHSYLSAYSTDKPSMATCSYLLRLGATPNFLAIHLSCVCWHFQIYAYNQNQGDLMHFLELKSSAFQYSNMECLTELCLNFVSRVYIIYQRYNCIKLMHCHDFHH